MKNKDKDMQVITATRPMPKEFAEIEQKQRDEFIKMISEQVSRLISKNAIPLKNPSLDNMCEFFNWDFKRKGVPAKAVPNYEKNEVEVGYYEWEVKI